MTNIVGQLFKSLDPWPGFQITSFKIQVSPVDGRKTLILDLRPVEGSMPICSRCRHEAPLVHSYVSRRIKEALQKPSLILRLENFHLLHRLNYCTNDCSGYF